jgi:hypothetical protein
MNDSPSLTGRERARANIHNAACSYFTQLINGVRKAVDRPENVFGVQRILDDAVREVTRELSNFKSTKH